MLLKAIVASIALAGLAASAMPDPVDAADETRAKARRAAESRQRATTTSRSVTTRENGSSQSGYPLRDRSTYYHRDGRLNGKELFDQINERGDAGK